MKLVKYCMLNILELKKKKFWIHSERIRIETQGSEEKGLHYLHHSNVNILQRMIIKPPGTKHICEKPRKPKETQKWQS